MKYLSKTCVCNTADMNALFMDGIVCLSPCVSIAAVVLLGELQSQWSSGQPLLPSVLCVSHMLPVCISPARETGSWTLRLHRYLIFKDFMVVFVLFSMIIEVYTSVTCFFFLQGHSHQLFHICAVVGTHFQLEAVLTDMTSRKEWLMSHSALPSFLGTVGALTMGVLLNLGIIGIFSAGLPRKPRQSTSASSGAHPHQE